MNVTKIDLNDFKLDEKKYFIKDCLLILPEIIEFDLNDIYQKAAIAQWLEEEYKSGSMIVEYKFVYKTKSFVLMRVNE